MCYRGRRCLPSTPLPRSGLVQSDIFLTLAIVLFIPKLLSKSARLNIIVYKLNNIQMFNII